MVQTAGDSLAIADGAEGEGFCCRSELGVFIAVPGEYQAVILQGQGESLVNPATLVRKHRDLRFRL